MELHELLEKVDSKESFLDFVEALKNDKIDEDQKEKENPSSPYSDGKNGWVNGSISQFLDSIHAYGIDNDKISLDWKSMAELFYAGKIYE
jgi:hypothetical protein